MVNKSNASSLDFENFEYTIRGMVSLIVVTYDKLVQHHPAPEGDMTHVTQPSCEMGIKTSIASMSDIKS